MKGWMRKRRRIGCELSDSNTRHHNSSSLNEACLTSVCLHTGKCAPCSHLHLLSEDCANQAALLPRVIVTTLCWETMIIIMFSCSAGAHGDSSTLLQQVTEREELWWQPERGPGEHGDPAPSLQLAARLKVSTPNTWASSVRPPPSPPISISSVTQLSLWMVPPGVLKLHVHISNTSLKLWHVFFNHSIIKWSDCVNSAFVRSLTYRVRMCTNVCVITETHWSEHFSFLLVFVPIAGIIVLMLAASNTRMPSITCCRNHHCCSCVRSCSYGHGERGCQQRGSPGTFFHWVIGEPLTLNSSATHHCSFILQLLLLLLDRLPLQISWILSPHLLRHLLLPLSVFQFYWSLYSCFFIFSVLIFLFLSNFV